MFIIFTYKEPKWCFMWIFVSFRAVPGALTNCQPNKKGIKVPCIGKTNTIHSKIAMMITTECTCPALWTVISPVWTMGFT